MKQKYYLIDGKNKIQDTFIIEPEDAEYLIDDLEDLLIENNHRLLSEKEIYQVKIQDLGERNYAKANYPNDNGDA